MVTPGALLPNVPSQTTLELTRPPEPKPAGTGKARPERKISSSPETGTVVIHVLLMLSKVVETQAALGENVIWAFGTARLYGWSAVNWIVEFVSVSVAPLLGMPLA